MGRVSSRSLSEGELLDELLKRATNTISQGCEDDDQDDHEDEGNSGVSGDTLTALIGAQPAPPWIGRRGRISELKWLHEN